MILPPKFLPVMNKLPEFGKRFFFVGKSSLEQTKLGVLWENYNHHLFINPILTKSITAGIIAFAADVVCQTVFPTPEKAKIPWKDRIDWNRTFNFTLLSTCVFPPITHYWYEFLSTKIIGNNFTSAIKRVACDQILFAPLMIAAFFAFTLFMEGKTNKIQDKLRLDLLPTLLANFTVWIPAQLINFSVIQPQLRVLWANMIGFFWSVYLSKASFKHRQTVQPTKEDQKLD